MFRRASLTATITVLGVAVGVAPAALATLALALAPPEFLDRIAGPEVMHRTELARADLLNRQAELAIATTRVPDTTLRAAASSQTAADRLARRLVDVNPRVVAWSAPTEQLVPAHPLGVTVRHGKRALRIEFPLDGALLREISQRRDIGLAYVREDEVVEAVGAAADLPDGFRAARPEDLVWRELDLAGGEFQLVGTTSGGGLSIVAATHGRQLRTALLLLALAGGLSGLAAGVAMNRRLNAFATAAERIAGGDPSARLSTPGTDGAARLAATLNSMSEQLEARIEELTTALDRLDRSVSATDEGICLWSSSGDVEVWNPAASRMTGVDPDDGLDSAPLRFLRGERGIGERRVLLPIADGRRVTVDLSVRPTRNGGTLQVFRDATPTLAIEQARANFLVTIAHELRTPLTTITGTAELLEAGDSADSATRAAAIRVLRTAAERLTAVVAAVADSAALVEQRIPVSMDEVRLRGVVEQMIEDGGLAGKDLTLGSFTDTLVTCDVELMARIVDEVVDNARKYGEPPIELSAEDAGSGWVELCIVDSGPALPVEMRAQMLEPFTRADPEMARQAGGIGLGLFIASRKAAAMGGQLRMDELDGATRMILRLPVADVASGQAPARAG